MSETIVQRPEAKVPIPGDVAMRRGLRGWARNPWRKPIFLEGFTWVYVAWSILPVIIAIVFSFNTGRSRSAWQGFSLRWWYQDPFDSLWHDPALRASMVQSLKLSGLTILVAVPLGTLFAIGLDRWRGRPARAANFAVLFSFVVPEIILGLALWLTFTNLLKFVTIGTTAQVIGLVTWQIAYAVIIVRARLLSIGREYEEAAMDLGASPGKAITRILLPLLFPAILAAAAIVFADSIDDFVTVRYLCASADCQPISVKIYEAARGSPTPAVNAAATAMLVATLFAVAVGFTIYRSATRGQRAKGESSIGDFAGQI
jgi:spermidine/putrescine transport system permease protein